MKFLRQISRKNKRKRLFVLGIDGTPFSYVQQQILKKEFPHFNELIQKGSFLRMNSVLPCVSSVAWTTFLTGVNPAKHNIQGFVDRHFHPFSLYLPTARDIAAPTIAEILSKLGRRVVSINVPVSYPPKEINGVQISCFLATELKKAVYPAYYYPILKKMGYRTDVDAGLIRTDKKQFIRELHETFDRRVEAAHYFMKKEEWDYFQLHIMETDRINHFLWGSHDIFEFERFYRKVDELIGEMGESLDEDVDFMVISDHGFCELRKEVYLNHWLEQNRYLRYKSENPKAITDMHGESRAYSLIPGRIYINLKGREDMGSVRPGEEYERLRNELMESLQDLKDPETNEKIVKHVYRREQLYSGPFYEFAPDLIVAPMNGYDLKGNINQPHLTFKGDLTGMHTDDDALLYIKNHRLNAEKCGIIDMLPTILDLMEIETPETARFDGRSLFTERR